MSNKPAPGTPLDFATNILTPHLGAFWPCSENAGTTLADATGNGNAIHLYKNAAGNLDPAPGWILGPHGPAISFDGATQWGEAAQSASLEPVTALTVGILVNVTAASNPNVNSGIADFIRKANPNNGGTGYNLRWQVFTDQVEAALVSPVTDPNPNTGYIGAPHLFLMTYDPATGISALYIDKTQVATATNPQKPALTNSDPLLMMTSGYYNATLQMANPPPITLPGVVDMAFVANAAFSTYDVGALVDNPWLFYGPFAGAPGTQPSPLTLTATPELIGNVPSIQLSWQ